MAIYSETRVNCDLNTIFFASGYLLSEVETSRSTMESRLYWARYSIFSRVRIHWARCLSALLQVQRLLVHFLRRRHTQV